MTFKDMIASRLKSLDKPVTCAFLKNLVQKKYKVKLSNGTISSYLYKWYNKGIVHRFGGFGSRGGWGYMAIPSEKRFL